MRTFDTPQSMPPLNRLDTLKNWEGGPRTRMTPTIAPVRDLVARLGNPHLAFRSIHVTGTKGKGSVCALLETALSRAGLRVGRYASPHVLSICERISVQGRPIAQVTLETLLERVLDVRDQAALAGTAGKESTWFDVLTAAAFLHFAEKKVEWVVAEVGLGGRLDSTNVLDSEYCVITNIGFEHTEVLGDTRVQIASEKAGIIKQGSVVVTGLLDGDEAHAVVAARALEMEATLLVAPFEPKPTRQNTQLASIILDTMGTHGLTGRHDRDKPLHRGLLDASALRAAALPGRFEHIEHHEKGRCISILFDGAHVDIALEALFEEVGDSTWATGPLTVLFALGRDKDARRMLAQLNGRAEHIVFTSLPGHDAMATAELTVFAREAGVAFSEAENPSEGMSECLGRASNGGWILVTGSLYLIAPARNALVEKQREHATMNRLAS